VGVLGVDTVVVMPHTRCGLAGVSDAARREATGADLGFFPIDDHADALGEDVETPGADALSRQDRADRRPLLRREERGAR
jgi:carbonic anhydrase